MTKAENCDNQCATCGEDCAQRSQAPLDLKEKPNEKSSVKKVIGVISGKGGVGKSLITAMLAVSLKRQNKNTAVLDADITGPSIPKLFGITERAQAGEFGVLPVQSKTGISVMSINFLLPEESDPVIWRGPLISGTVKQFWTDVVWEDIDFMFVDMPPGTSDVALTVFQSLPLDGIIIVTSPQELVAMIVAKAVNMAKMMNIPILGIIENMSYVECPDCGKQIAVFGESHLSELAQKYDLRVLDRLPLDPAIAQAADSGNIEQLTKDYLPNAVALIRNMEG